MAGHSKWANIKHRKQAADAQRGKIFTKLIREITVAAKKGGDLATNPTLRLVVDKALAQNMKKDTIQNAIARGVGGDASDQMEAVRYEGYGPSGVAVMVDCLTDNRNRTVGEVRFAFTKAGGNLGTDGSVAYLFTKTGFLMFAPGFDENKLLEAALEAGANDMVVQEDGSAEVLTNPDDIMNVKETLEKQGFRADHAQVIFNPATRIVLTDPDAIEKMNRLQNTLEELDDVQEVHHNAEF